MMNRVLITGGAGFLGSRLAETLATSGVDVTIADVVPPPRRLPGVGFRKCDLTDPKQIERPQGVSVVYHLAAYSSPAKCEQNPDFAFRMNVQATYNVLRYCVNKGVGKVVFPSAAHLYGDGPKYLPIDEAHPLDLASHVYNATKKIGEDLCKSFRENHGLDYVVFRLFNTYGPGQSPDFFIPSIISQGISKGKIVVNNGKPRRDFIFVDDIVDAFVRAGSRRFCGGPLNLGTGIETSVGTVARIVARSLGVRLTLKHMRTYGPLRSRCDNRAALSALGWRPRTSLRDGLAKTIKWYQAGASSRR